jgi:hypothetical protein
LVLVEYENGDKAAVGLDEIEIIGPAAPAGNQDDAADDRGRDDQAQ